jgi:6-pyruvoyltetrahydropterin/6-carboxytetrahydropterin synthase
MNRYQVTKTIEFSYGHRLLNHNGKCRYLHGHNGMLEVDIDAEKLDAMGMVVDFSDVYGVV